MNVSRVNPISRFSGEDPTDPNFKLDKKQVNMDKINKYVELNKKHLEANDEKVRDNILNALNKFYDTLNHHEKHWILKNV